MKACVPLKAFGSVIGKALRGLEQVGEKYRSWSRYSESIPTP